MRILLLSAFFLNLLSNVLCAQESNLFKLPEFLPPSPDVASIMKGGELSASPHTGGANASIPLYQLKLNDFTLPISLNYSSNFLYV